AAGYRARYLQWFGRLQLQRHDRQRQAERFGVLQLARSGQDLRRRRLRAALQQVTDREGEEIFGYTPVSTIAATNPAVAAQVESGAIKSTDMMPNEINSAFFQQTEKRDSITSNIQIKPNDNFEAGLGLMYIRDNLSNWNQSMYAFPMWLSSTVAGITSLTEGPGGVISGGHNCDPSTDATCPGAGGTVFDNQVRHSVVTTKGADLHATFRGARWQLSGQVGVSTSRTPSTQAFIEPVYFGGYTWDINKG